jgi:glycosyltransferase involved in cell wall biosynthesis
MLTRLIKDVESYRLASMEREVNTKRMTQSGERVHDGERKGLSIKVAFFIPGLSDGGAQRQCIRLLNELQTVPDIDVSLYVLHQGVHQADLDTRKCTVYEIGSRTNYDPQIPFKVAWQLRKARTDVLVTWLQASDIYGWLIRLLVPRLVWVMTERDSSYPRQAKFWLRNRLGRFADAIVCNSDAGRLFWKRNRVRSPLYVVDNIRPTVEEHLARQSTGPQVILYVGRFEAQKNVMVVAKSFVELATTFRDLRFKMVGQGSLWGDVKQLIDDCGLSDRFDMPGFRPDVLPTIAAANVLVNLSHHEGTPNTLIEALCLGSTVVASNIPEHVSLLGPRFPYLLTDRQNPSAAAELITEALQCGTSDADLLYARKRLERMTPRNVTRTYLTVFDDVLAQ